MRVPLHAGKDHRGEVLRVACYSDEAPQGLALGRVFRWRSPRFHQFMDGAWVGPARKLGGSWLAPVLFCGWQSKQAWKVCTSAARLPRQPLCQAPAALGLRTKTSVTSPSQTSDAAALRLALWQSTVGGGGAAVRLAGRMACMCGG